MIALLLLAAPSGCSDLADCNALFDLTFVDGTQAAMDACEQIDAVGSFEFDPDDPAEFRSTTVKLTGSAEVDSDCWIQITLNGVCGTGRYTLGSGSEVLWDTHDCSGIPDEFEASFVGATGHVDLTLVSAGEDLGTPEEATISAFLAGDVDLEAVDGTLLSGSFDLVQDFTWTDTEDDLCSGTEPTDTVTDTGPPAPGTLSVTPAALHFGAVTVDTVGVESLLVANVGEGDLLIESIESDQGVWTWRGNTVPRVINPGQSSTVYVDFLPTEAVEYTGALTIASDDPATPTFEVLLTGSGG